MASLIGKTALVTGAARGIGRAIARRLAADGALVAVHYRGHEAEATQTVAAIEAAGGRAFTVHAEFGTPGDLDALFGGLTAGLAGRPLDILVNNAAHAAGSQTIETATGDEFDRIFAANVRAPFFVIQRALPVLCDGGRIVNISSAVTRIALDMEIVYAMSKGALNILGRTCANRLGQRGITINTVAPGVTRTDATARLFDIPGVEAGLAGTTALGRVGEPADIAAVVAFLASDDARWITGQVLDATGGMYLGPKQVMAGAAAH